MEQKEWYSIKECANIGNISTQAVYKKINHKNNGDFFTGHIRTIAGVKYLDKFALEFVLGTTFSSHQFDTITNEILDLLNDLNPDEKQKVLNFVKKIVEISKY